MSKDRPLYGVLLSIAGLLLLLVTIPARVAAREDLAHDTITMHALGVLPDRLKEALEPYSGQLISGVGEPDRNRIETHKIHLYSISKARPLENTLACQVR